MRDVSLEGVVATSTLKRSVPTEAEVDTHVLPRRAERLRARAEAEMEELLEADRQRARRFARPDSAAESKAESPRPPKPSEPKIVGCGTPQQLGVKVTGAAPALAMQDGSARWPGMDHPVFAHLNLTAREGSWTAVTGPSGSGKSTVLATLLGFLSLESGRVLASGEVLDPEELRGYAAWCPQAAHIFESTSRVTCCWPATVRIDRARRSSSRFCAAWVWASGLTPCRRACVPPWVPAVPSCRAVSVSAWRWLAPCW